MEGLKVVLQGFASLLPPRLPILFMSPLVILWLASGRVFLCRRFPGCSDSMVEGFLFGMAMLMLLLKLVTMMLTWRRNSGEKYIDESLDEPNFYPNCRALSFMLQLAIYDPS